MGRIHLGTSGWSYQDWRPLLYPPKLPQGRWLERYAQVFTTVEVNFTFYRLPTREAAERWHDAVPRGFVFACKGSRYLTHRRRLLETGIGLHRFFDPLEGLGKKLGPVLWQLPPQWKRADPDRLENFLAHLPAGHRYVFEFRSEGWYRDEVFDVLDRHGAAVCEHDLLLHRPQRRTGSFRYLRFHGSGYGGRYGAAALRPFARELRSWGGEAWVYFNNDRGGAAVLDAITLSELLGEPLHLEAGAQLQGG